VRVERGWHKTDGFVKAVLTNWQTVAKVLGNVPEMVIGTLFPWCFTPELYAAKPEYIEGLAAFVRSRPAMTVGSFLQQSNAVIGHDAEAQLGKIAAPTLITFGRHDQVTSLRFAEPLKRGIRNSELVIFEGASHAPIYEVVEEFNGKTLEFLKRQADKGRGSEAGAEALPSTRRGPSAPPSRCWWQLPIGEAPAELNRSKHAQN